MITLRRASERHHDRRRKQERRDSAVRIMVT
jgi:hypothetical protein